MDFQWWELCLCVLCVWGRFRANTANNQPPCVHCQHNFQIIPKNLHPRIDTNYRLCLSTYCHCLGSPHRLLFTALCKIIRTAIQYILIRIQLVGAHHHNRHVTTLLNGNTTLNPNYVRYFQWMAFKCCLYVCTRWFSHCSFSHIAHLLSLVSCYLRLEISRCV